MAALTWARPTKKQNNNDIIRSCYYHIIVTQAGWKDTCVLCLKGEKREKTFDRDLQISGSNMFKDQRKYLGGATRDGTIALC